jgi:hypothetical protein
VRVNWQVWWNAVGTLLASAIGILALAALTYKLDKRWQLRGWLAMAVAGVATALVLGLVAGAFEF